MARAGLRALARRSEQARRACGRLRLHAADSLRPRRGPDLRAHPQPAGHGRRAQSPGPREDPHPGGAHHRERRAARGDALCTADRLRRKRHQSLSRHRDAARPQAARPAARELTAEYAEKNFIKAINKGLLKTFSKMGISTLQSYRGAQVFEAVGLNQYADRDAYFPGTASRIEGVGLDVLAREAQLKHAYAFQPLTESETELAVGGALSISRGRRVSPAQSADHRQAAARRARRAIPPRSRSTPT